MYLKVKDSFTERTQNARRQIAPFAPLHSPVTPRETPRPFWLPGRSIDYTRDNGGVRLASFLLYFAVALMGAQRANAAKLSAETASAFDHYVDQAETRMREHLDPARFLRVHLKPELSAKLRSGELVIESGHNGDAGKIPGGMLQDWVGMMFIPGATIAQVKAALQSYQHYQDFYKPEVTESKELAHSGDEYDVFLRLYEKYVLTVVLNTTYHVRYAMLDPRRMTVTSHSTRIAEVKDPDQSVTDEQPVGDDSGFLWRLNSYWRFEAADGGVYAECEAISLSGDVPLGLGWMIKGFLERFPKESMLNTLRGTRAAVMSRAQIGN